MTRAAAIKHSRHSGAAGFTLLEILVAMSVMAIALVVVFQLFSAGLTGLTVSDDYLQATVRAEAKMREVLDDDKLEERSWSEVTTDGYRFDVAVQAAEKERTEGLPVTLLAVDLTVHWTRGARERAFTLKTMKLMSKKL